MPNQILDVDGVAFEIVEDQGVGEFLFDQSADASDMEPATVKTEVNPPAVATPRTATPAAKVQVVTLDNEPDDSAEPEEGQTTDEDLTSYEAELDEWINAQLDTARLEGAKSVQSVKDREVAKLQNRLSQTDEQMKKLREDIERAKLEGLTDSEREAYVANRDFEKQRDELKVMADEIDDILKEQVKAALVEDYGQYGVTADALDELDEPEDMERFCERAELKFYRDGKVPTPAQAAPQTQTRPQSTRPVPAGAHAPSDLGGQSPTVASPRGKIAEGTGAEAMAATLSNLPYESVRV